MLEQAGGLANILDEPTLRSELHLQASAPITAEVMAECCKACTVPSYPVIRFCCFLLRKHIFKWVGQDMSPDVIDCNFARLLACMAVLENVWTQAGLLDEVLAPFPPGWYGGAPTTDVGWDGL